MIDKITKKEFKKAKKKIKHPYSIHLEDWKGSTSGMTILSKEVIIREEIYYSMEGTFYHPNWAVLEVNKRIKTKKLLKKINKNKLSKKNKRDLKELIKKL